MIHEIHFEIPTSIKYKGEHYNGIIEGYAYINEDKNYGQDRDGKRGERTLFLEEIEFGNISIDLGEDVKFIEPIQIENSKQIRDTIFDDCIPKI
jgi:hypothetical protein